MSSPTTPISLAETKVYKEAFAQLQEDNVYLAERIAELEFAREDIGWQRVGETSGYEFSRDFLRRLVARSRLFYLQNPLINRAVTLQADYVFAQGVNMQATNKIVNAVIQEFLDDTRNQAEFTSHSARLLKEQTLLLDGNVFFVLFTDKADTGKVQLRSILVDEITEIVTNPDDSNEVWFYKREWNSVEEEGRQGKQQIAYYPDINHMPRNLRGDIKQARTRNGKPVYWDAPVLHIKTGALAKSRFGAPETYSALDWAKAHSKMLADWATIIAMFARYALKMTVNGDKASVVAARNKLQTTVGTGGLQERNPPSTVGSVFITKKDGVDLEPIKTSGATTSATDSRQLRLQVAAAMGLPDPMLSGEVDVGNLATAKTLDRPTELKFRSRQQLWTDVTMTILNWVIRWAVEAPNGLLQDKVKMDIDNRGRIIYTPSNDPDTGKPIDLHLEVTFPPILERTIQERIDAVIGAVTLNGKTFMLNSPALQKLTIRLMLQAIGLKDVDELVDQVFDELIKDQPQNSDKVDDGTGMNNEPEPEPTEVRI